MTFDKPTILEEDSLTPAISDLDTVTGESMIISSKNLNFAVPLGPTSANRVSNTFGKVRSLTVNGIHTGGTYNGSSVKLKILAFITQVEDWANADLGAQQRRRYTSIFGEVYKVFCVNFRYRWVDTFPEHIEYQFDLTEGGNITSDVIEDLFGT